MDTLQRLGKSQVKRIISTLEEQYGIENLKMSYAFFKNNKGRIFIVNREYDQVNFKHLRINNTGLYFANISDNSIRLTIEGSQIIGPLAEKNIVEIKDDQVQEWMLGEPLNTEIEERDFVIIKNKKDYLGCGRRSGTGIANFLPKSRRIKSYKSPVIMED